MVALRGCEYARCQGAAQFGFADEGQPRFCSRHKTDDMRDFLAEADVEAPSASAPHSARNGEPPAGQEFSEKFADPNVRFAFMQKVLSVVTVQFVVTAAIVLTCRYVDSIHIYILTHDWIFWTSWGLALFLIIAMSCSGRLRYVAPWNYLFVVAFTLSMAFMLAVVTAYYSSDVLAFALILTLGVVSVCFLLALSRIDFTKAMPILTILLFILIIMAFIGIFVYSSTYAIVFGVLGAVIFSIMLISNLQMIMGGKKHEIGPEDWVAASLLIYLDIINIFQYILLAAGAR